MKRMPIITYIIAPLIGGVVLGILMGLCFSDEARSAMMWVTGATIAGSIAILLRIHTKGYGALVKREDDISVDLESRIKANRIYELRRLKAELAKVVVSNGFMFIIVSFISIALVFTSSRSVQFSESGILCALVWIVVLFQVENLMIFAKRSFVLLFDDMESIQ